MQNRKKIRCEKDRDRERIRAVGKRMQNRKKMRCEKDRDRERIRVREDRMNL